MLHRAAGPPTRVELPLRWAPSLAVASAISILVVRFISVNLSGLSSVAIQLVRFIRSWRELRYAILSVYRHMCYKKGWRKQELARKTQMGTSKDRLVTVGTFAPFSLVSIIALLAISLESRRGGRESSRQT